MIARRILSLLAVSLSLPHPIHPASAAEPGREWNYWAGSAKNPIPAGARVILETDRPACLLGENVLIH